MVTSNRGKDTSVTRLKKRKMTFLLYTCILNVMLVVA